MLSADCPADAFKAYRAREFVRVQSSYDSDFIEEKLASNAGKYPLWEKDVRTMLASIKRSIDRANQHYSCSIWKPRSEPLQLWSLPRIRCALTAA